MATLSCSSNRFRPGRRKQIAARGRYAEWRRDGKEIVFISGDSLMSVSVDGVVDGQLRTGAPQRLFEGVRLVAGTTFVSRPIAISRDGSRIFLLRALEQPGSERIRVVRLWPAQ